MPVSSVEPFSVVMARVRSLQLSGAEVSVLITPLVEIAASPEVRVPALAASVIAEVVKE